MKLQKFIYSINVSVTIFMVILLIPSVFDFVAYDIITLPKEVGELTYIGLLLMLPWPAAIGYRRFYQGILIRNHLTKRVALGTVVRLSSMTITAFILFYYFSFPGVIVGAGSLSVGVTLEAIATKLMVLKTVREIKALKEDTGSLSYKAIIKFYYPLALMSFLALGINPIVTFFLGKSSMALESLAVLPVVNALVFIFRAVGLSYQEVVIALIGDNRENYKPLKNMALKGAVVLTSILAIIALTPLSDLWFKYISGLPFQLAEFAKLPLIIMIGYPAATLIVAWQRGILVRAIRTIHLTIATLTEVIVMFSVLFIGIKLFSAVGVIAAAIAYILGRSASNLYLIFPLKRLRSIKNPR